MRCKSHLTNRFYGIKLDFKSTSNKWRKTIKFDNFCPHNQLTLMKKKSVMVLCRKRLKKKHRMCYFFTREK